MERKIGLSSAAAFSRASVPQGNHSTGLSACWRRYGLVSSARWFTGQDATGPRGARQRETLRPMDPTPALEGKTADITGASRGIGLAIADRFLGAGANVMLCSRKADDLAEGTAGLVAAGADPAKVAWQAAHVGEAAQAQACLAETVARFG